MAKAYDVIGYSYDAGLHCEGCAQDRFPNIDDDEDPPEDSEGNEVHPIFEGDEQEESIYCGTCGDCIREV